MDREGGALTQRGLKRALALLIALMLAAHAFAFAGRITAADDTVELGNTVPEYP